MTIRLSNKLRTNLAGSTGFAATFADGIIDIYSGTQPASADLAPTGTKLGRFTLASGAFVAGVSTNGLTFATAADGAVSKSGVWSFSVGLAAGTAGYFRLKTNAGADVDTDQTSLKAEARLDGSIATSGADMNLSNTAITTSSPVTIDVFTWTQSAS